MEKVGTHDTDRRSQRYAAFLLRLWRESPDRPWRASLQRGLTARPQHFASLTALIAFLEEMPAEQMTESS